MRKENMSNILKFDFQGQHVSFDTAGWINATEAAAKFGKRPVDWLKLDETKSYIDTVSEFFNCEPKSLLKTQRGRYGSGTWLHPKLAVRFAQWLDIKFAVWCDMQIDALIRSQTITYTDEQIVSILTLPNALSWEKRFLDSFYLALSKMTGLPFAGHLGGTPSLFGKITAEWVYEVALPAVVYQAAKAKAKNGEKIHQYLSPEALRAVESQLITITAMANSCTDYKDFVARCSNAFNKKGQVCLLLSVAA